MRCDEYGKEDYKYEKSGKLYCFGKSVIYRIECGRAHLCWIFS